MLINKLNLKQRLILITSTTVFVTAIAVFLLTQEVFGSFMRERFFERINFLAKHLGSGITLGLILKDVDMLQKLSASVLKEEAIVALKIYTAEGQELLALGQPQKADGVIKQKVTTGGSQAPFQEPRVLGEVQLFYSTAHLDRLLRHLFWQVLLVSLLLASLMGLLGYFLITRAFVRPLNELLSAVKEVEKGDLSVKVSGEGLPETEELAQAFSQMLSSLRSSRKELRRTYEEMLRTRSMAEIGRFSLMIAHEIKNPLGIIKGSLDILRKPEVGPEIRTEMLQYIEEEVHRLDDLIQNFLTFAKPQRIKPQPIFPEELLQDIARRAALEHGQDKIRLETKPPLPQVFLDPEHVGRALLNLIKNAFEAKATQVTLKAYQQGPHLVLEVKDNGTGLAPQDKEKIFEPFFTTKAKGTGLGLSMVAQVLEAHGGKVEVEDTLPHGTIFRLIFPLNPPKEEN